MDVIGSVVAGVIFLVLGYVWLRGYWKGYDGLNSELFK